VSVPAAILAALLSTACARPEPVREFQLHGQILAVRPQERQVVIRHEEIPDFMAAMTMPFPVQDAALLDGKSPGDLITATLVVGETSYSLSSLTTTGHAPIPESAAPPAAPDILEAGEPVADAALVNQAGEATPFSSFRGHRVALTFIYTRCPLPEFCPLMDRNFAAIQRRLAGRPDLADVRLVTITFDPEHDTPDVLAAYAQRRGADPAIWSFLTGEPGTVYAFGEQFGLYVEPNPEGVDITHNLRTAVVDPEGRLVGMHGGNDWTPDDIVADLTAAPAPVD
jgi:protein SCO1/2